MNEELKVLQDIRFILKILMVVSGLLTPWIVIAGINIGKILSLLSKVKP